MRNRFIIVLLAIGFTFCANAQDSLNSKKWGKYNSKKEGSRLNSTASKLKDALESDDETMAARQYENLSKQFEQRGDLAKAEEYLSKALKIYSNQKDQTGIANTSRAIAKLQESQNKLTPAISNYLNAAEVSKDKNLERANNNDAKRLQSADNPQAQQEYAKDNIDLFKKNGNYNEVADAYKQVAETQVKQNDAGAAAKSYEKAIEAAPPKSEQSNALAKRMVDAYSNNNQIDTAIVITHNLIAKAKEDAAIPEQIDQMILLSDLYAKNNQEQQAISTLQQAYILAMKNGNTFRAKTITEKLAAYFQAQGNTALSISTYKDFLQQLDSLIKKDSSLLDAKLFDLTEGRIQELEQEKILQTELLKKKTTFSYFLIGSIAAMALLLLFIIRSLMIIKKRNKKIALQSLRREMNPHFIFNSLNSVNQYIAENNELEANKYLSSYSSLMRNIMEHSNKDFVSIATELEQLEKYLELEHRRFKDAFEYRITMDETIDKDLLLMPNMILQPHLENAVWHGLRYKETKGLLTLHFGKKENRIEVVIIDNGIGLTQSQQLKTANQKVHTSRGLTNTKERIQLLNDIYKVQISMQMSEQDKQKGGGTMVCIQIPILNKLP